jgi:hypothetical protein
MYTTAENIKGTEVWFEVKMSIVQKPTRRVYEKKKKKIQKKQKKSFRLVRKSITEYFNY